MFLLEVLFQEDMCTVSTVLVLSIQNQRAEEERAERERQQELRSYKGIMETSKMTSNKDIAAQGKSLQDIEDDFM